MPWSSAFGSIEVGETTGAGGRFSGSADTVGGELPLSVVVSSFVVFEGGVLAAKNPRRLCCPLLVVVAIAWEEVLLRFAAGAESTFAGRLPLTALGLADTLGNDLEGEGVSREIGDVAAVGFREAIVGIDGGNMLSESSTDSSMVLLVRGIEGFLVNMSRMLRRLSNSWINFPDIGKRFLFDHSCLRTPSSNMPGGLTMSRVCVSRPSTTTLSFKTAYTGQ
jgi:hypothetical protein